MEFKGSKDLTRPNRNDRQELVRFKFASDGSNNKVYEISWN